jgi:serine/threonine-protein kinase haspin
MISFSYRQGDLRDEQLYAMIVLENGGVDLETFEFDKLTGWKQAWGTVLQVAKTLAEGEAKARFEVSLIERVPRR